MPQEYRCWKGSIASGECRANARSQASQKRSGTSASSAVMAFTYACAWVSDFMSPNLNLDYSRVALQVVIVQASTLRQEWDI